jgi:flagellar biosynthetic protein FliR
MEIPVDWAIPQIIGFVLVVARLSGLFLLAPVFSSLMIPMRIKIMALLVLAVTITPIVLPSNFSAPNDALSIMIMIVQESLIGFALGFTVSIVFSAIQTGASMLDTSIGFSLANIIDPLNNSNASIFGSFYTLVGTLAFLSINGHYWLLAGFTRSYKILAVGSAPAFNHLFHNLETYFTQLFVMAFEIVAPVLVTLVLVDIVLGIVARVVPQMNVFFVGIPLKIGIGLAAVILALPSFVGFLEHRVSDIVSGTAVLTGTQR